MTTLAPHRDTVDQFVASMHAGADKDALSDILAEDVVLYGPLDDEPLTGRQAVLEAIQTVSAAAADLTYREVLSGTTHHAAYSGCRSTTPWSTEWTASGSTPTARSPR
ncbi:ketosteroid isomerase family protein [Mycolicibacterium holsaticum]|uniref:ketosteroid isomerase family protein n=1 Tax=Mycolicibacterium holsaticum TaxID=152142 RepID=UPI001F2E8225|nr:nuclear transport factor 2 family protein [Mycolicibacterium holsaticum]